MAQILFKLKMPSSSLGGPFQTLVPQWQCCCQPFVHWVPSFIGSSWHVCVLLPSFLTEPWGPAAYVRTALSPLGAATAAPPPPPPLSLAALAATLLHLAPGLHGHQHPTDVGRRDQRTNTSGAAHPTNIYTLLGSRRPTSAGALRQSPTPCPKEPHPRPRPRTLVPSPLLFKNPKYPAPGGFGMIEIRLRVHPSCRVNANQINTLREGHAQRAQDTDPSTTRWDPEGDPPSPIQSLSSRIRIMPLPWHLAAPLPLAPHPSCHDF
jgi:hypothetical protein